VSNLLFSYSFGFLKYRKNTGKYKEGDFERKFKSWLKAKQAAGLKPKANFKIVTRKQLIADLKKVAAELQLKTLTINIYESSSGKYKYKFFRLHFNSWKDALKTANLLESKESKKQKRKEELARKALLLKKSNTITLYSREEVMADIRRVAKELNSNRLSWVLYRTFPGKCTDKNIFFHFRTWQKAVVAAGLQEWAMRYNATKESAIEDLKKAASMVTGESLTYKSYRLNGGKYNYVHFTSLFSSWPEALKLIGRKPYVRPVSFSKEELIKDLQKVAKRLKKSIFTSKEYENSKGKYSTATITARFITWQNALEEAGLG
jgi:hypothetical protein